MGLPPDRARFAILIQKRTMTVMIVTAYNSLKNRSTMLTNPENPSPPRILAMISSLYAVFITDDASFVSGFKKQAASDVGSSNTGQWCKEYLWSLPCAFGKGFSPISLEGNALPSPHRQPTEYLSCRSVGAFWWWHQRGCKLLLPQWWADSALLSQLLDCLCSPHGDSSFP